METVELQKLQYQRDQRIPLLLPVVKEVMDAFWNPYHNFPHAEDVSRIVRRYAELEGIPYERSALGETAGLLHDLVTIRDADDNEEITARIAKAILPQFGYRKDEISAISEYILATKKSSNPGKDKLKQIICDADLDNLGRPDFFERTKLLQKESGIHDDLLWYKNTLQFMKGHQYYTVSAQHVRNEGKQKNMALLEGLIAKLGKSDGYGEG